MAELRGEARARAHGHDARILAADADAAALDAARANARAARARICFRHARLRDFQATGRPGLVVTNPPYGVRLKSDDAFLRELAGAVCRLHGWRVAVLAGSARICRAMGLKPRGLLPVNNGGLDCRLAVYDVP
jgi:23S rRNA G2445 N2-methylase RlmL